MDIFGRCNGGGSGSTVAGNGAGSVRTSSNESAGGGGTSSGTSESGSSASGRMQLTGASAPGAAASPESGVSPLTDAYTKMTSDILAERTLGDFVSEHPGELVRTGNSVAIMHPQIEISKDYRDCRTTEALRLIDGIIYAISINNISCPAVNEIV